MFPSHCGQMLYCDSATPKNRCLGPQNDLESLGPEKIEKKCQNENHSLCQWNRWVATDIHLDKYTTNS
jgi:hypothetical protein